MSLPGLPPLPKSLSGFELTQQQMQMQQQQPQQQSQTNNYHNLLQVQQQQQQLQQQQHHQALNSFDSQRSLTSSSSSSISRKNSTLDTQLAILRREMVSFYKFLFRSNLIFQTIILLMLLSYTTLSGLH